MTLLHILGIFLLLCLITVDGKLKEGECEVCIKFLKKFENTITDEDRKSQPTLTKKLKEACSKRTNSKDNRFCYYIGGTEIAATSILADITKPLGFFKGVEKICEDLKKKDRQICELAYEKELDWKNIDLKKMRVRELKKILSDWDEDCRGCLEKSEFIDKIESIKHRHIEL